MKKFLFVLIAALFLAFGCSDYEVNIQQKQTEAKSNSFETYIHKDEDGCEYIVVYAEKGFNGSYAGGLGLGIEAKVNQPSQCKKNGESIEQ